MARTRLLATSLFAACLVLTTAFAAGPSQAQGSTDQDNFLAAGAKKLTPKQLKKLFSGSKFVTRDFTVRNFKDGSRVFDSRGYSVQLRWWIDGRGRFCIDTRRGGEYCDIEYFRHGATLKTFNNAGMGAQTFSIR